MGAAQQGVGGAQQVQGIEMDVSRSASRSLPDSTNHNGHSGRPTVALRAPDFAHREIFTRRFLALEDELELRSNTPRGVFDPVESESGHENVQFTPFWAETSIFVNERFQTR